MELTPIDKSTTTFVIQQLLEMFPHFDKNIISEVLKQSMYDIDVTVESLLKKDNETKKPDIKSSDSGLDAILKELLYILPSLSDIPTSTLEQLIQHCNRNIEAVVQYCLENESVIQMIKNGEHNKMVSSTNQNVPLNESNTTTQLITATPTPTPNENTLKNESELRRAQLEEENAMLRQQLQQIKQNHQQVVKLQQDIVDKSVVIFDEIELYWKPPFKQFSVVDLIPEKESRYNHLMEGDECTKLVQFLQSQPNFKYHLVRVQRIQNPDVWKYYALYKKDIIATTNNNPTERYLFHGTDWSHVESIARGGFDPRLSKTSGLFGTGIYFAEDFGKSLNYLTGQTPYGEKCMLLCRVLLGTSCFYTAPMSHLRLPPLRSNGERFHSVVGQIKNTKGTIIYPIPSNLYRIHCVPPLSELP